MPNNNFIDEIGGMQDPRVIGRIDMRPVLPPPPRRPAMPQLDPRLMDQMWVAADPVFLGDEPADFVNRIKKALKKVEEKGVNMHTVMEMFGQREKVGTYGVEIEVEGNNLPPEIAPYFAGKHDGSLRGESLEYVFIQPLHKEETLKALNLFVDTLKEQSILDMSFRTSVHVHVNVQKMTRKQLCCFLYLAFLFEDAIVKYSGEHREGNRFCLRVKDAYNKIRELENLFLDNRMVIQDPAYVKYSAINLATIKRYGSVEFRSMRGVVDKEILTSWIEILDKIYVAAAAFDKPVDIANAFIKDPVKFAKGVFGEQYDKLAYPAIKDDMMDAYTHLITLPYEFKEDQQ